MIESCNLASLCFVPLGASPLPTRKCGLLEIRPLPLARSETRAPIPLRRHVAGATHSAWTTTPERNFMTAIKDARRLIEDEPLSDAASTIADLVIALESEASFRLERLYALKLSDFEIATALIDEWRLARYYAK